MPIYHSLRKARPGVPGAGFRALAGRSGFTREDQFRAGYPPAAAPRTGAPASADGGSPTRRFARRSAHADDVQVDRLSARTGPAPASAPVRSPGRAGADATRGRPRGFPGPARRSGKEDGVAPSRRSARFHKPAIGPQYVHPAISAIRRRAIVKIDPPVAQVRTHADYGFHGSRPPGCLPPGAPRMKPQRGSERKAQPGGRVAETRGMRAPPVRAETGRA